MLDRPHARVALRAIAGHIADKIRWPNLYDYGDMSPIAFAKREVDGESVDAVAKCFNWEAIKELDARLAGHKPPILTSMEPTQKE